MLTLDNFDQQLPKDLLKNAQPYFLNGAVLYAKQDDGGVWRAEVDGSNTYSVEITLNGRTLTECSAIAPSKARPTSMSWRCRLPCAKHSKSSQNNPDSRTVHRKS